MQPRKLNYRATWELNVSEPVSGNYYPVNPIISFNDSNRKLRFLFIEIIIHIKLKKLFKNKIYYDFSFKILKSSFYKGTKNYCNIINNY